ncbi:hypothetical protein D3C81_1829520 [compost metagenome]
MGQHLATGGQDFADDVGRGGAVAQLHRRLQHRQGEALHAVAVEAKVAPLDLGQALHHHWLVGVIGQQVHEPFLAETEDGLVVPQGVVGIEADRGDGHGEAPQIVAGL